VEDHCAAIRTVLERGRLGETYNIGGNSERKNLDVVTAICNIVDEMRPDTALTPRRNLITFVTDRPGTTAVTPLTRRRSPVNWGGSRR